MSTPSGGSDHDPDHESDSTTEHAAAERTDQHPPTKQAREQLEGEEQVGIDALTKRD